MNQSKPYPIIQTGIYSLRGAIILELMLKRHIYYKYQHSRDGLTGLPGKKINLLWGRQWNKIYAPKGMVYDKFDCIDFDSTGQVIIRTTHPTFFTPVKLYNSLKRLEDSFNNQNGKIDFLINCVDFAKTFTDYFFIEPITLTDIRAMRKIIKNPGKFSKDEKYKKLIGDPLNPFLSEVMKDVLKSIEDGVEEYSASTPKQFGEIDDILVVKLRKYLDKIRENIEQRNELLKRAS